MRRSSAAELAASGFSYVARQPILTVDEKVYGYELLFRDGIENHFRETDADSASRRTLDTSLQMGLEQLCDSRRGFVNCTREILLKDYMTLLPSTLAVVEVLESVPVDDLVIAALKRLNKRDTWLHWTILNSMIRASLWQCFGVSCVGSRNRRCCWARPASCVRSMI